MGTPPGLEMGEDGLSVSGMRSIVFTFPPLPFSFFPACLCQYFSSSGSKSFVRSFIKRFRSILLMVINLDCVYESLMEAQK